MSPIRLADFDSDSDDPEGSSSSQDNDNDRMLRDYSPFESTYPRIDGEWAIGDEVNEPVAIVGIGTSMCLSFSTDTVH